MPLSEDGSGLFRLAALENHFICRPIDGHIDHVVLAAEEILSEVLGGFPSRRSNLLQTTNFYSHAS